MLRAPITLETVSLGEHSQTPTDSPHSTPTPLAPSCPLPTWSRDLSVLQGALPPCLAHGGAQDEWMRESPRAGV